MCRYVPVLNDMFIVELKGDVGCVGTCLFLMTCLCGTKRGCWMCQYVPVLNDMFIVELKGMLDVSVRSCS